MKWVSTFKYLPIEYGENIAYTEDLTQRVTFENNVDGDRVRIRFTNRFGKNTLRIKKATIGKLKNGALTNVKGITLNGREEIVLSPGQEIFSDEIGFEVWAGEKLTVSMYFKDRQDIDTVCCFWSDCCTKVICFKGDATSQNDNQEAQFCITAEHMINDPNRHMMRMFAGFDAVQVLADEDTKVIAAFGDSITHMSFYTSQLQKRLYDEYLGRVCLINCGIGGNRLLEDATYVKEAGKQLVFFGKAGVSRFERDVFELDEVDVVLALIGINDIMHPIQLEEKENATGASELIDGYKHIIRLAHENGAEIFFGTVTPCGNEDYPAEWIPKFEETRTAVNEWIRKGELLDGFFDFDRELSDKQKPGFMVKEYSIGDGLHPNTPGGRKMAECVDLRTIMGQP